MANKKPESTAKTNVTPKSVHHVAVKRKIRLLIIGKGTQQSDYWAFNFARENVIKSYTTIDNNRYEIVKADVSTAKELVAEINKQDTNSIRSLDIFSHGGPQALYMTVGEPRVSSDEGGFSVFIDTADRWVRRNAALYRSTPAMLRQGAIIADSTSLGSIEFDRFMKNVKVELHGCETAQPSEEGWLSDSDDADNFAGEFSLRLYEAGHDQSVVIGSPTKSSPNIKGSKTQSKEQDYRHGKRWIFKKGKKTGETTNSGHLDENKL